MNIQDIIKNQDILDCWKEIQKSNADKNISKEVFGGCCKLMIFIISL
ncbi:hypothetical protein HMPREF2085_01067 [Fusobacterium nucleatum 13_3C]|uniref:Uncharacterized protein n=1 Tax=Fusobacterium nucleatum 13_3C TaxID=1357398 RepID=X7S4I9_FUSNU|nr:hypothetical protein [Fusobacterium nucleatum]ETZ28205.1 hypothetical protein HMPREF2085_01067 [Fusobacterium nucleatum 13_3C]